MTTKHRRKNFCQCMARNVARHCGTRVYLLETDAHTAQVSDQISVKLSSSTHADIYTFNNGGDLVMLSRRGGDGGGRACVDG
jgi:hypothetical protein